MAYRVTFWGTRGSIPTPGSRTTRYGGNTPCVSLENLAGVDAGRFIVLDAGTGIRLLGKELAQRANGEIEVDLLLSHTHWDHIQGLPFFAPFFEKGNAIRIWGPQQGDVSLEAILRKQMDPVVFPVPLDRLSAELSVAHVHPDEIAIDGFNVKTLQLRHPGNTLGYRLTPRSGGASIAYVTDNELGNGGNYDVGNKWRQEFVSFLEGVQVLVHDSMYTPEELNQFSGWGHSSYADAVTLAVEAGVDRLVMFHHSPEHDDATMDTLVDLARQMAGEQRGKLDVIAATEGLELTL